MVISIFTAGIPMVIAQILFVASYAMTEQHGRLSSVLFSLVITAYAVSIFRYHESVNLIVGLGTILTVFGILKCVLNKK